MNMPIYLYADEASLAVLEDESDKLIFIGSDFGYGNFGDILQHINSLNVAKKLQRFSAVSVMGAGAIGFRDFPAWGRRAYGTDAIIFVSDYPLIFQDGDPALTLVRTIRNPSVVHLYGGGFLNDKWGDFVLGVTEYFLHALPGVTYLVSGQQITSPYQKRVLQHIRDFQPAIFGVRDGFSRQWLKQEGFLPDFSFDDATEALFSLSKKFDLKRSNGLLLHINTSDYTADDLSISAIRDDLSMLAFRYEASDSVTLLQAFRDPRHEVKDSRESIKLIDSGFPFVDYRTLELAPLSYRCFDETLSGHLAGDIGCSSSYHVALWLQLSGIPCWLRSANPFYDQKSKALQVHQDLQSFLEQPSLADHSLNLERRAEWLERLCNHLRQAPAIKNDFSVDFHPHDLQPWRFYFKGLPTLEEKNQWQIGQTKLLETRLSEVEDVVQVQRQRADVAEAQTRQVQDECRGLRERLEAMSAQLTETGHVAHEQRERAEAAEAQAWQIQDEGRVLSERLEALQGNYQQMLQSRSWRLTKPMRAITRYVQHGHFDAQGKVGLYGVVQRIGRRLPVSVGVRRHIGQLLSKLRR